MDSVFLFLVGGVPRVTDRVTLVTIEIGKAFPNLDDEHQIKLIEWLEKAKAGDVLNAAIFTVICTSNDRITTV